MPYQDFFNIRDFPKYPNLAGKLKVNFYEGQE